MITQRTESSPEAYRDLTGCQEVRELMPWWLNGSLEEHEQEALLDHVASCESCQDELEQTAQAWEVMTRHVPSMALAEYSQGLAVREPERERIERHLALCPTCREELELAMSAEVVELAPVRRREAAGRHTPARRISVPRRRWLAALAASVVLSLSTGLVIHGRRDAASQSDEVASVASGHEQAEPGDVAPGGVAPTPAQEAALFTDGFESSDTLRWSKASL